MRRVKIDSYLMVGAVVFAAGLAGPALASSQNTSTTTGVPIEAAGRNQKELAGKQFQMGVDLFKANKFDKALEILRMSMEKVSSPNTRLMIANTLIELGQLPEAYQELKLVIAEAEPLALAKSKYQATVQAARANMKELEQKLSMVELDPGAVLLINGNPLPPSRWSEPLPLPAGETKFELKLSNGQIASKELTLQPGTPTEVELQMSKPEPETVVVEKPAETKAPNPAPAPHSAVSYRALAWTGAGIAGAGAIGFSVFGLMASSRSQQLQDECTGTRCPDSLRDVAEQGRSYQTWANVSLGVGLVGLVGGAFFFLSDSPKSASETGASAQAKDGSASDGAQDVTTALDLGPGGVNVRGTF